MYAITGVTGHVGGAAARELAAQGERIRVVVRDRAKAESWREESADVVVADFDGPAALAEAFRGCSGAFVMLPSVPTRNDADHRRMADTIAAAVRHSAVPHVVLLSSVGADLPDGTGPIRWLHYLENRLRETDAVLTVIRPFHFQEKVETVLDAVLATGTYPIFGDSADVPTPMIATRDIGTVVARCLLTPPPASQVVDLDGPLYTERQVAEKLAAILGTPLEVVTVPRPGWTAAMVGGGLPPEFAEELAALYDADQQGLLQPRGDRQVRCTTGIEDTLQRVVATAQRPSPPVEASAGHLR